MENLFYNISQVLGITLINSLWQGLLVYLLVRLYLIGFPSANSNKKYPILYGTLTILAIWFAYTFYTEAQIYTWTVATNSSNTPVNYLPGNTSPLNANSPISQPLFYNLRHVIKIYLPYISALYIISVVVNLIKLAMAWQNIRHIKKHATAAVALQKQVNKLVVRIGIVKPVKLNFSQLVDVPCAIGYIKPILLLPVTISTQLSADEIEVILLHELAHIKYNDYLLNLIQQVMILLLYLNPFAHLIDRMINRERENRCDDIVLQLEGDPLTYAGALIKLEKTRQSNLRLALAATDSKYYLFERIQRIMQTQKPVVNIKHLALAMVIFIGSLGSIAWLDPQIKDGKLTSVRGAKAIEQLAAVVKKVIAPVPVNITSLQDVHQPSPVTVAGTANTIKAVTKDTITTNFIEKETLIAEYRKLNKDINDNRNTLQQSPESKQYAFASKIRDSLRRIKEGETLTPALIQEAKAKQDLISNYLRSPKVLQKQAERQRVMEAWHTAEINQPEMIEFEKLYAVKKDSALNKIMLINNLTEEQAKKSDEYEKLINRYLDGQHEILLKIMGRPEIKVLLDSMDNISNSIFQDPEYVALREKTKASQEYLNAISPSGLEKYEAAAKEALDKLKSLPAYKKIVEDTQKGNIIVQKLKQMP